MWIYLPHSITSACSPASADSISDSALPSHLLAASLTWRGKPLPSLSWRRVLRTTPWMTLLSSAMCAPSTARRGVERWIASLRDGRALPSLTPDGDGEPMMTDGSGPTLHALSRRPRPGCSSSKTCPVCSAQPDNDFDAYAAGLIDGEGSITISRTSMREYTNYQLALGVEMSVKALTVLNAMHDHYGGTMNINRQRTGAHSSTVAWRMHGETAACLLYQLLPYMVLKRQQAEIVQTLFMASDKRRLNGDREWTPGRIALWEKTREDVVRLNTKGWLPPEPGTIAQRVGNRWVTRTVDLFGEHWETFSGTWPRSGSMRNGVCFRRPEWAPPIDAGASSSSPVTGALMMAWSTPMGSRRGGAAPAIRKARGHSPTLQDQITVWTPLSPSLLPDLPTTDGPLFSASDPTSPRHWPAPAAMNPNRGEPPRTWRARAEGFDAGGRQVTARTGIAARLNPAFVDWLMGFPPGFSSLAPLGKTACTQWAMRSSRLLARLLSPCSGSDCIDKVR